MRRTICSHSGSGRLIFAACGTLLIAGSLAWTPADANEPAGSPVPSSVLVDPQIASADLERMFWQCDYVSNTFGVGLQEGAYCFTIYEEVKKRKFGGDFGAMLAWWQQNKSIEYAALAAKGRTANLR